MFDLIDLENAVFVVTPWIECQADTLLPTNRGWHHGDIKKRGLCDSDIRQTGRSKRVAARREEHWQERLRRWRSRQRNVMGTRDTGIGSLTDSTRWSGGLWMGGLLGGSNASEGWVLRLKLRAGILNRRYRRRHGWSRNVGSDKRNLTTDVCLDRLPSYCQSEEVRG